MQFSLLFLHYVFYIYVPFPESHIICSKSCVLSPVFHVLYLQFYIYYLVYHVFCSIFCDHMLCPVSYVIFAMSCVPWFGSYVLSLSHIFCTISLSYVLFAVSHVMLTMPCVTYLVSYFVYLMQCVLCPILHVLGTISGVQCSVTNILCHVSY